MFRYFYRIWDKFRYKNDDTSEIVAAAIYTYKGDRGKDTRYVYKPLELEDEILIYNFRVIDVEKIDLRRINENNPLKLVFKMAKELLKLGASDEEVYNAKIKLANELSNYDKVKNNDQIKALVYFLEYLFLIQDEELDKRYKEFKGGKIKMTVDEVRDMYLSLIHIQMCIRDRRNIVYMKIKVAKNQKTNLLMMRILYQNIIQRIQIFIKN